MIVRWQIKALPLLESRPCLVLGQRGRVGNPDISTQMENSPTHLRSDEKWAFPSAQEICLCSSRQEKPHTSLVKHINL